MMRTTVVTVWKDNIHFLRNYADAMANVDRVIIVDNGSRKDVIDTLVAYAQSRTGVQIVTLSGPTGFSCANNIGFALATTEAVFFVNNDVYGEADWIEGFVPHLRPKTLVGPTLETLSMRDGVVHYLSGWLIGGLRSTWDLLATTSASYGPWRVLPAPFYYEDVDLALRAKRLRIGPRVITFTEKQELHHIGNGTSGSKPIVHAYAAINAQHLEEEIDRASGSDVVPTE